jgi:hypothetical protein
MAFTQRVTNIQRFVIYYEKSGIIYMEGLLYEGGVMARSVDSDMPVYLQYHDGEGLTGLEKLTEHLSSLGLKMIGLACKVLDTETMRYSPAENTYFNRDWQKIEPKYIEVSNG